MGRRGLAAAAAAALGGNLAAAALPPEVADWWPTGNPATIRKRLFVEAGTFASAPERSGFQFPRYDARFQDGDEVMLQSVHDTWMAVTDARTYSLRGRAVALLSATGSFCSVPPADPQGGIRCDQTEPLYSSWLLVAGDGGKVTIKDVREERFCGDDNGTQLRCTRDHVGLREAFFVEDAPDSKIAFRSGRTGLYCADRGDSGIRCDEPNMIASTVFQPVADLLPPPRVIHTQDESRAATFVVERKDFGSLMALRCKGVPDAYLMADEETRAMVCSTLGPRGLHLHSVHWWDAKTATLQVPSTKLFVQAGDPSSVDPELFAESQEGTGWALWRVRLTGGFETIRPLIRGVNLGNWLLLERWMAKDLFLDEGQLEFIGQCPPVDEYGLMHSLDVPTARRRMEHHWSTWITESDIAWLASVGVNAVRVPFGYWVVDPSPPFVLGQLKHLDNLFEWCEKHSVAVLLDFHGLKGSQTGNPTSGSCGGCGREECGATTIDFLMEAEVNLNVIGNLSQRYSKSLAYLGFEIANEVAGSVEGRSVMSFYQKAYDIIRHHSSDALVIMFATFNPSSFPFQNFTGVAQDIHIFFGMGFGSPTTNQHDNMLKATEAVTGLRWNALVGEWSLGASGQSVESWSDKRKDTFFRDFARMQLQTWESHTIGWFYWSYKTSYANSTWNFRDMCMGGWLPGCSSDDRFGPAEWWSAPPCAFRYFDGRCVANSNPNFVPIAICAFAAFLLAAGGGILLVVRPELRQQLEAWYTRVFPEIGKWGKKVQSSPAELMQRVRSTFTALPVASPGGEEKAALVPEKSDCTAELP